MTSFSARRCAGALLCAALVLAAVCAHASIAVSSDVTQSGDSFNGDTISFNLEGVTADVVTVELVNSKVTGSGLTIQGYTGTVPSSVTTRVSMSVTSTTVTESTIYFSGVMPTNSDIRLSYTTGTLTAAQSLFDFTGLVLKSNVTVTVEQSTVTWPSSGTNTGSIVTYSSGSTTPTIATQAALFILNATANYGASVLHLNAASEFDVTDSAVLAVDYGRCVGCSSAMVDIDQVLKVDGSSLFRVSHGTVVGGSKGLLSSSGSVTVSDSSLYIIANCTIESGSFFDYNTGDDSGSVAFAFTVTDSTVSFLGLEGPSFGITSGTTIPTSTSGATINGGSCTIGGTTFTTTTEYSDNGIAVTQLVDSYGGVSGNCASTNCVPGHTSSTTVAEVSGTQCACVCSGSTYNPPACTTVSDPTQTYTADTTCSLANCASCDRLYPASRCAQCNDGYELSTTYQCVATATSSNSGSSTSSTSTTTSTTTTTTTTTTALCSVAYCEKCNPTDGSTCVTCRNGYTLTSGSCIANYNGATAAQSALLAALVCVAAAVYTL